MVGADLGVRGAASAGVAADHVVVGVAKAGIVSGRACVDGGLNGAEARIEDAAIRLAKLHKIPRRHTLVLDMFRKRRRQMWFQ